MLRTISGRRLRGGYWCGLRPQRRTGIHVDALHRDGGGGTLLQRFAIGVQHLNGKTVFAAIDVYQFQAGAGGRLSIGLAVEQQAQAVVVHQLGFYRDLDAEGAVIGAQGLIIGDIGQFEAFVGILGLLVRAAGVAVQRLAWRYLDRIGLLDLHLFALHATGWLVGEDRVAIGAGVFVDL